jgi:IS5 family transposase
MLMEALPCDRPTTVAGDKGYDTADFVNGCRALNIVPHVAQNISGNRGSAIDGRTTRHAGYAISQRIRKRVEEIFGWLKTIACFRKTRFKGKDRTQFAGYMVGAAYNLLRIAKLRLATA